MDRYSCAQDIFSEKGQRKYMEEGGAKEGV